jgi:hypothetical protein
MGGGGGGFRGAAIGGGGFRGAQAGGAGFRNAQASIGGFNGGNNFAGRGGGRFAGGGYLGGVKVVRGFTDPGKEAKVNETKVERPPTPNTSIPWDSSNPGLQLDERQQRILKRRSAPPGTTTAIDDKENKETKPTSPEIRESLLKRQISSMVIDSMDPEKGGEAVRRRDEKEIQTDYVEHDGEDQARQILRGRDEGADQAR